MGARENNCEFHKMTSYTMKFLEFYLLTIVVKFDIYFLGIL